MSLFSYRILKQNAVDDLMTRVESSIKAESNVISAYIKHNSAPAEALGKLGNEIAVDALCSVLENNMKFDMLRESCACALGQIGGKKAKQYLINSLPSKSSINAGIFSSMQALVAMATERKT